MLNGFDPLAPRFLADLERIQERSQKAERQISSGFRVETASDDPDAVVEILRLGARLATNTQVQTNLTRVKSQVDASEAAVRQAEKAERRALQRAGKVYKKTKAGSRADMGAAGSGAKGAAPAPAAAAAAADKKPGSGGGAGAKPSAGGKK